ncbi:GTPase-associated system all-helical protein GASH [Vibrio parahaemolyticus]|uniref:GTPase-associated system all-helical protein GASH n=1 Tax=Vibrio TaxID=662 RepID=UPI00084B5580|nr:MULTISPECIES: GTPase-associated system all-helical protein GASH [Vibrio]EJL6790231.1 hypothetical protein [Vibrio alginolyticus]HBC3533647.1 hypothetical protein [Vibrio vulnificus]MBH9739701.1 hypothetical protein [Vibrio navarrensis]MBO0152166.1 hypothetical protein [Vibrio parahaemolyticus]MCR9695786.1 hypothetical protein [Vibrio parahaemolyticus]
MSNILEAFLVQELIEGHDERYEKVESAATLLSDKFKDSPTLLINAIQVGISPSSSLSSNAITLAKECLVEHWKSFSSAYTNEPINLYRGIILRACELVSEESHNAAIMWLTACDTLPLLSLGKEEEPIKNLLISFSKIAETKAVASENVASIPKEKPIRISASDEVELVSYPSTDKVKYLKKVGSASGPNFQNFEDTPETSPTPHNTAWPNSGQSWSHQYAKLMADFLSTELGSIVSAVQRNDTALQESFNRTLTAFGDSIEKTLNQQRLTIQRYQKEQNRIYNQERAKVNTLWWSEALYSDSHNCSYRSIEPELASVVMPFDLLKQVTIPTVASVPFALSETVNKLPEASFVRDYNFYELLTAVRQKRDFFNQNLISDFAVLTSNEKLSICELVLTALSNEQVDLQKLLVNSLVPADWKSSLPHISRALFRQLQAYELAKGAK